MAGVSGLGEVLSNVEDRSGVYKWLAETFGLDPEELGKYQIRSDTLNDREGLTLTLPEQSGARYRKLITIVKGQYGRLGVDAQMIGSQTQGYEIRIKLVETANESALSQTVIFDNSGTIIQEVIIGEDIYALIRPPERTTRRFTFYGGDAGNDYQGTVIQNEMSKWGYNPPFVDRIIVEPHQIDPTATFQNMFTAVSGP